MNTKQALPLVLLLASTTLLAEVGDIHTIKVDNAVVREGPDKKSTQVDKLGKGAEIMEMDIQGEWYEIYVASTDLSGWMHVSTMKLLGVDGATPSAAPAPDKPVAAKPVASTAKPAKKTVKVAVKSSGKSSSGMKKFKKYLVKYNARTNVLKGYIPFSGAEDVGNGELHLTVTETWLEKPKARQKSSLITLYSKWKKANNLADVKVYAIDSDGTKISNYPR